MRFLNASHANRNVAIAIVWTMARESLGCLWKCRSRELVVPLIEKKTSSAKKKNVIRSRCPSEENMLPDA